MSKSISFALVLSMLVATSLFATPPADLSVDKQKLEAYVANGNYDNDIAKVTQKAEIYINQRVKENHQASPPQKLAVVFDIDETSLSNYQDMLKLSFGGTDQEVNQAEGLGHDPAIAPTLALYNDIVKQGVFVFFVTGRSDSICPQTMKNMKAAGYTTWQGFYCKPKAYQQLRSAVPYKTAMRKAISEQGYTIIADIGDQFSDLQGGYTEKTYRLPNPFYEIP